MGPGRSAPSEWWPGGGAGGSEEGTRRAAEPGVLVGGSRRPLCAQGAPGGAALQGEAVSMQRPPQLEMEQEDSEIPTWAGALGKEVSPGGHWRRLGRPGDGGAAQPGQPLCGGPVVSAESAKVACSFVCSGDQEDRGDRNEGAELWATAPALVLRRAHSSDKVNCSRRHRGTPACPGLCRWQSFPVSDCCPSPRPPWPFWKEEGGGPSSPGLPPCPSRLGSQAGPAG